MIMKKIILVIITSICFFQNANVLCADSGNFNNDYINDILWRNVSTGQVNLWFMNDDGTTASTKTLINDPSWTVVGIGDVNNNGISDIIWRQASTGKVVLWFMNADGTRTSAKTLITDKSWTVVGTGHFNADDRFTDILWRQESTGKVVLWLMNIDGTRASSKTLITDPTWTVAGTGYFNYEGFGNANITDILWRQASTGKVVLWFMNADGTRSSYKALITDSTWTVADTGYFNNAGLYCNITDILWRQESTGKVVLWFMNEDGSRASTKTLITDVTWTVANTGDFNSNGITDILWRQASTGKVNLWFMNADGTRAGYKTLMTDKQWTVVPESDHPSGSLDESFGTGGKVTTPVGTSNDRARALGIQSDGKIVVAGDSSNGSTYDFALVRYNADGSLDATFGTGGKVTTAIGSTNDYLNALGIQSDGKIVVAGDAYNGSNFDFALVRYNTDGTLDTTFDGDTGTGNGKVITNVGGSEDRASALGIQSDGKIVVAGWSFIGIKSYFTLVRYNVDGSIDTTFGTGGKVTTAIGSGNDYAYALGIQSDGKIVVAGYYLNGSYNDFALVRYNADGSLDTTFGTGGKVTTSIGSNSDYANSLVIQSDGRIVVAGYYYNGTNDFALVRYNADGSLDTTFGTGGKVTTPVGSYDDFAFALGIQSDGRIVATGSSSNVSSFDFALVRYNANGSLDTTFGTSGKVTTAVGSGWDQTNALSIQSDGRIVAAGYSNNGSNNDFAVVRYWP